MDEITFRRTIYADPYTQDPEVVEAAKQDPKKQAFWEEIRAMEASLEQAMDVPVPDDLADKLILRQSMKDYKEQKQRRPWYFAMAASVVLASLLTVGVVTQSDSDLTADVFAHMSHVEYEVKGDSPVDLAMVNDKLATYNGSVEEGMGDIVSANYCYLDSIKSLHLIIKGENGLSSLFVLPSQITETVDESFSNEQYSGASFFLESAKVIVVGEDSEQVTSLKEKAQRLLSFSI
ncbi:DUF3379 family protein [Ningiella sp. W23]|uniref:DUF3379 family protein n=1 Tax=Ningiella sp. W23 TaxID=3023715 RepID=UPI0037568C3F